MVTLRFTKDLVLQDKCSIFPPTAFQDNRPNFHLPIIELLESPVLDTEDKTDQTKKAHVDLYSKQTALLYTPLTHNHIDDSPITLFPNPREGADRDGVLTLK